MSTTEKTKCTNSGNWIEFCDALAKVTTGHIGDIQVQVMRKWESTNSRLVVFSGRFKKNQITLNYCPFCGENITTEYVQEEQA